MQRLGSDLLSPVYSKTENALDAAETSSPNETFTLCATGGCFTYAFIPSIYGLEAALIAAHLRGPSGSFRALKRLLVEKPINQSLQIRLSFR